MITETKDTPGKTGPMTEYSIVIDDMVWQKINYWVQKAVGEVSGLGKVVIKDGVFRVTDAILVSQENTGTSTDLDPAAIGKAMYEMRDVEGHLNFWWHSHVHMGVFWSGTDLDTIREIGQNGFLVSTVFNKAHEMKSAIYIKAGEILPEVFIDDVETEVVREALPSELVAQWDADFMAKCKTKVWTWNKTQTTTPPLTDDLFFKDTVDGEFYDIGWEIDGMSHEPDYDEANLMLTAILKDIQTSSLHINDKVYLRKLATTSFANSRMRFAAEEVNDK